MEASLKEAYLTLIDETLNFLRSHDAPLKPCKKKPEAKKQPCEAKKLQPKCVEKKGEKPAVPTLDTKKVEEKRVATLQIKPDKKPVAKKKLVEPAVIKLTKPALNAAISSNQGFISFMKKDFPSVRLHQNPQSDIRAKAMRFAWKDKKNLSAVPLLYDNALTPYKPLLENIAKAISLIFMPSRLLDVSSMHTHDTWQMLLENGDIKLVVAPDSLLSRYPLLKELTSEPENASLLGPHPLLHLPDLSLYQKDPLLKRSLWETLCQKLQTS